MALSKIGTDSLDPRGANNNTATDRNVAIGDGALRLASGTNNTALGYRAGYNITTAGGCISIGSEAGFSNSTGNNNVCIGNLAGNSVGGPGNVFIGPQAGQAVTSGTGNCFVGQAWATTGAGSAMTTGNYNTIIGGYTGQQHIDLRTSSNHIVMSDGSGNPRTIIDQNGVQRISGATTNRSATRAYFQIVQGVLTSAASGVAKSFIYVGHHHCLRIYISVGGPNNPCSGGTWMGRSLFTCGSGSTTQEQTQTYYSGSETNLSSISVNYQNGSGENPSYANYILRITNNYSGTTPLIWYTVEGISNEWMVPLQD